MLDIEIRQLRDDIINLINSAQVPLEAKRLVMKEILEVVSEASDNYINQQKLKIIEQLQDKEEADDHSES